MREKLSVADLESFFGHLKNFILELETCTANVASILDAQFRGVNLIPINNFLGHYVGLCYSQCAINAYKIFHSEEKRSFTKLFNKLQNFEFDNDLKQLLYNNSQSEENSGLVRNKSELLLEIAKLQQLLVEKESTINKVKLRRLKRYAHTDPEASVTPETLEEVQQIKELSITIYNRLYGKIFGAVFLFNSSSDSIYQILEDRETVDKFWEDMENLLHNKNSNNEGDRD